MFSNNASVISSLHLGCNFYIVHLSCREVAREAAPGQFVQVRVGNGTDPFLRRTFSIYDVDRDRGHIRLMIEVVGPGTGKITAARPGDCLNIIGPLGKGFDLDGSRLYSDDIDRINKINRMKKNLVNLVSQNVVLVAGGAGIAPLIFLAETLVSQNIVFMVGARTAAIHHAFAGLIPTFSNIEIHSRVSLLEATDDGSLGYHGFVAGLLDEHIASHRPDVVFTCGPYPMMKAVAVITARAGIRCQASLEERMACGMGACYGCAVPLKDGRMARSCVDGPVFDAHEVDW